MPLKPSVDVKNVDGLLIAEFWECLRLDPAPVLDLHKHYEQHIRQQGRRDLIIDMNGIAFAGSASLSGFLKIHRTAKAENGRVVFCNVDPTVLHVFRVSHIESLLTFATDREAAITLINEPETKPTAPSQEPSASPPPLRREKGNGPLRRPRKPSDETQG